MNSVPIILPSGNWDSGVCVLEIYASKGNSLSGIQPNVKPYQNYTWYVFKRVYCHIDIFSKSSCCISLTNKPLPPTLDNCLSTIRSLFVTISLISISRFGSTAFNLSINCWLLC